MLAAAAGGRAGQRARGRPGPGRRRRDAGRRCSTRSTSTRSSSPRPTSSRPASRSSAARRLALVGWAAAASGPVVEDDYDAEFRYDRRPVGALAALAPDHVVYLGSTSKTLSPALHLGWLVAPGRARRRPRRGPAPASARSRPRLDQHALAHLIGVRRLRPAPAADAPALPAAAGRRCSPACSASRAGRGVAEHGRRPARAVAAAGRRRRGGRPRRRPATRGLAVLGLSAVPGRPRARRARRSATGTSPRTGRPDVAAGLGGAVQRARIRSAEPRANGALCQSRNIW